MKQLLRATLIAALTITAAAACTSSNNGRGMQPTITLQQARDQATAYGQAAQAQLPGSPKLVGPRRTSLDCDDPTDNGPKGRVDVGDYYDVDYHGIDPLPDNTTIINHMYDYWSAQGYQVLQDTRSKDRGRHIRFENPKDGFRFGLVEADTGSQLSLQISAPCVWPNGTPQPK
jgi:hypothetical protein